MRTPRNIQSPYVAADFWTQFSSANPRMALFMKVTPYLTTDLTTIGLTSNTRDMTLPGHAGVTFKSAAGMMPSNAAQSINDETSLELTGIYSDDLFKRTDVVNGKWQNATIEIFVACWDNVNLGELMIFKGFLGEVKDFGTFFTAEGRGLSSKLSQDIGWVTQRTCRVKKFRDAQCGHTASTVTIDGTTYNVEVSNKSGALSADRKYITFQKTIWTGSGLNVPPISFFANGTVECTQGKNIGFSREITSAKDDGTEINIYFKRPFPYADNTIFDRYKITAGCSRTIEDCQKYDNILNFRGEPFIPGLTQLMRVPRSDEWEISQT